MKDLTYKIMVKQTAEEMYLAVAPSLEDCYVEAPTEKEAVEQIQELISEIVRDMIANNEPLVDDSRAAIYNLTIEFGNSPSA
jgi:predicted RNase H-like HicB family nuclease